MKLVYFTLIILFLAEFLPKMIFRFFYRKLLVSKPIDDLIFSFKEHRTETFTPRARAQTCDAIL